MSSHPDNKHPQFTHQSCVCVCLQRCCDLLHSPAMFTLTIEQRHWNKVPLFQWDSCRGTAAQPGHAWPPLKLHLAQLQCFSALMVDGFKVSTRRIQIVIMQMHACRIDLILIHKILIWFDIQFDIDSFRQISVSAPILLGFERFFFFYRANAANMEL